MIDATALYDRFRSGELSGTRLRRELHETWRVDHWVLPILGADRVREMFRAGRSRVPAVPHILYRGVREDEFYFGWSFTDDVATAELYATVRGGFGEVISASIPPEHVLDIIIHHGYREYVVDGDALEYALHPFEIISEHHGGILSNGKKNPHRLGASLFGAFG